MNFIIPAGSVSTKMRELAIVLLRLSGVLFLVCFHFRGEQALGLQILIALAETDLHISLLLSIGPPPRSPALLAINQSEELVYNQGEIGPSSTFAV